MSRLFIIETKSKKWWKRLFREPDVELDIEAIKKRNEELEEELDNSSKNLLDGFCPFTNLGDCRSDCNNFKLGKVHKCGQSWWDGVYVGSVTPTKCKLWFEKQ